MSHIYSGRHNHSSQNKTPYQSTLPQFDLSRRVKLPPIIKNELLTGRNRTTSLQTSTWSSRTTAGGVNVCFPQIIETQPPRRWNQNRPSSQNVTKASRRAPAKNTILINHVGKSPIQFPNSYTVLPPIGQSRSWPYSGLNSTLKAPPRNSEQTPKIVSNKVASQRKRLEKGPCKPSPSARNSQVKRQKERITSFPNTQTNSIAVVHRCEKALFSSRDTSLQPTKTDAQNTTSGEVFPSLSDKDVEMSECDPIHLLEKVELSKEVEQFLVSKNSRRRGGKCLEIDPSLKTAVDIIRDNLLRQTMEELCMMW